MRSIVPPARKKYVVSVSTQAYGYGFVCRFTTLTLAMHSRIAVEPAARFHLQTNAIGRDALTEQLGPQRGGEDAREVLDRRRVLRLVLVREHREHLADDAVVRALAEASEPDHEGEVSAVRTNSERGISLFIGSRLLGKPPHVQLLRLPPVPRAAELADQACELAS